MTKYSSKVRLLPLETGPLLRSSQDANGKWHSTWTSLRVSFFPPQMHLYPLENEWACDSKGTQRVWVEVFTYKQKCHNYQETSDLRSPHAQNTMPCLCVFFMGARANGSARNYPRSARSRQPSRSPLRLAQLWTKFQIRTGPGWSYEPSP